MARSAGRTRPVIKDVAKLAGVSAPPVSRYLNGTVNVRLLHVRNEPWGGGRRP